MGLLAALLCAASASADEPSSFELRDYRWVPVMVRTTPTAIDVHFQVISGQPTVHVEMLTDDDFLLFSHHRPYDTVAITGNNYTGGFQRMIETPGRYRVLIRNDRGAPPVTVTLAVHTDVDPSPASISIGVPSKRKWTVILASLAIFLAAVMYWGSKLLRAWRHRSQPSGYHVKVGET